VSTGRGATSSGVITVSVLMLGVSGLVCDDRVRMGWLEGGPSGRRGRAGGRATGSSSELWPPPVEEFGPAGTAMRVVVGATPSTRLREAGQAVISSRRGSSRPERGSEMQATLSRLASRTLALAALWARREEIIANPWPHLRSGAGSGQSPEPCPSLPSDSHPHCGTPWRAEGGAKTHPQVGRKTHLEARVRMGWLEGDPPGRLGRAGGRVTRGVRRRRAHGRQRPGWGRGEVVLGGVVLSGLW